MTWGEQALQALRIFAIVTVVLGIADRLWFAKSRAGRWRRLGAPWRRFACVTRESAHEHARRFWIEHPIRKPDDPEDNLAGGIFYTLIWLFVLFLNFAIVAQILDIIIPSAYTINLLFVGPVGEAAVAAAPIVIVLEMVVGILVHVSFSNGRWDIMATIGKIGALLFASAFVVLEGLGSWYRGIITGGVVLTGTPTNTKLAAAILSAVIGSVVPVAEMYTGAKAWQLFIPRFIVSIFYRTQSLGLWIVTGWLHLIAGHRMLRIHPSISDIGDDAVLLAADADQTGQSISALRGEIGRLQERHVELQARVGDLGQMNVGIDGLESDKAHVLVLVRQLEDWIADFERSTESLSAFAAARRLEIDGPCPLRISLPEVRDCNPKLCESLAIEASRKVDAWVDEVIDHGDGPLTRCLTKADSHIEAIDGPGRGMAELSQQLDAFRARVSEARAQLDRHNERLTRHAADAHEWRIAIRLASGDSVASEEPEAGEGTALKLKTLREEGFVEAKELNANAEHAGTVLADLGELRQKLASAQASADQLIIDSNQLADAVASLQREYAEHRRELGLDSLVDRCVACKNELEAKRRYLTGASEICVRPILKNLLSQWLAHVRIRGRHVTDPVILAREPIPDEERKHASEKLLQLFDGAPEEEREKR